MTRTVSTRISYSLHEQLRDHCNNIGCTINEFVAAAIERVLTGKSDCGFDLEEPIPVTVEHESQATDSNIEKPIPKGVIVRRDEVTTSEVKSIPKGRLVRID